MADETSRQHILQNITDLYCNIGKIIDEQSSVAALAALIIHSMEVSMHIEKISEEDIKELLSINRVANKRIIGSMAHDLGFDSPISLIEAINKCIEKKKNQED